MTLPITLDEATHRYRRGDHVFAASVTQVVNAGKSQAAIDRIMATRDEWAPRGITIHRALEHWLTTSPWRSFHPDAFPPGWPYSRWIHPLLSHPIWQEVEPLAAEQKVGCEELDVCGTFDGAWTVTSNGQRVLFDLKSQARADSGPYDTRPQIGGYLVLAGRSGWSSFHGAATIWARPGRPPRIQHHSTAECINAWWDAYHLWRELETGTSTAIFL